MSVMMEKRMDPAGECVRYLALHHTYPDGEPRTIARISHNISQRYNLPIEELEKLTAPLTAMEDDLSAVLDPRQDLWQDMFYSGSEDENLLAWSFFILEQQHRLQELSPLELKRRLLTEALTLEPGSLDRVHTVEDLIPVVEKVNCGMKTKWVCLQTWQDPMQYYEKYRTLVDLTAGVLDKHAASLQPLVDQAVERAAADVEKDMDAAWESLGLVRTTDSLIIAPLCLDFNGLGICWDDTAPDSSAYQFVGILKDKIRDLVCAYGDRAELLAEQLKIIADPRRMETLMSLKKQGLCGQELAELLHVTPGTVSHHMSSLVGAGFVSVSKSGSRINYTLQRKKLADFIDLLRASLLE